MVPLLAVEFTTQTKLVIAMLVIAWVVMLAVLIFMAKRGVVARNAHVDKREFDKQVREIERKALQRAESVERSVTDKIKILERSFQEQFRLLEKAIDQHDLLELRRILLAHEKSIRALEFPRGRKRAEPPLPPALIFDPEDEPDASQDKKS